MADPQANSLREFASKMIRMIISDPKWEFPKEIPGKIMIYVSTRVKGISIPLTLMDFQEKISLRKIFLGPFWKNNSIFPFLEYKSVFLALFSDFSQIVKFGRPTDEFDFSILKGANPLEWPLEWEFLSRLYTQKPKSANLPLRRVLF